MQLLECKYPVETVFRANITAIFHREESQITHTWDRVKYFMAAFIIDSPILWFRCCTRIYSTKILNSYFDCITHDVYLTSAATASSPHTRRWQEHFRLFENYIGVNEWHDFMVLEILIMLFFSRNFLLFFMHTDLWLHFIVWNLKCALRKVYY